jgi:hypothetical protein
MKTDQRSLESFDGHRSNKKKITPITKYTTGHLSCTALSVSTGNF